VSGTRSTTQLLESSLIPGKLGYWCLASLYGTMCLSSLFLASPVARALRERKALVLGAATYVVFVGAYTTRHAHAHASLSSVSRLMWL
jgi:hypothetical protein